MATSLKHPVVFNRTTRELVSPLGKAFKNAREYDPGVDKAQLTCVHCFRAAMSHHNQAEPAAGDNLPGNTSHFQTNPRSPHADDCIAAVFYQDEDYDPDKINHDKGFKIYVGMGQLRRPFNRHNPALVRRDPSGEIVVTSPDLIDRETISAKSPKDLVRLLKSGHINRVNDSKIVYHNEIIPWADFFVRKSNGKAEPEFGRWIGLAQRLVNGSDQPALFHVDIGSINPSHIQGPGKSRLRYSLPAFTAVHPETGRPITVVPLLQIKSPHMFDMFKGEDKEFLVMSLPRIYPDQRRPKIWYMDIPVDNPKKVVAASLQELSAVARERAALRQAEVRQAEVRQPIPA